MNLQTYATLFLILSRRYILCYQYSFDRLNIKLDELLELIAKEYSNGKSKSTCRKWKNIFNISVTTPSESVNIKTDLSEDLTKRHKVWSRWGKWGDCSVTCGDGIISRRRVCVAGRCALGEIEEQHRPCTRTPCDANSKDNFEPGLKNSDGIF